MSTQRVLYGVENSNYSAYKSEICYLTFDKKDANLHAECMTGDYQSSRDHHDDLVNNDSDLYSSVFNYDFGGGTALINVIKFDLADLSRYPVGTDDYMKYIHNPENGERPTKISIDSHLEMDTTKSTLRKFLEENGIVISKRFNLESTWNSSSLLAYMVIIIIISTIITIITIIITTITITIIVYIITTIIITTIIITHQKG